MATLGRWTGAAVGDISTMTNSYANVPNIFTTQARNDGSAYTMASATSLITLPSSNLADGYFMIARFETDDTSAGRFNPQCRIERASGTGTYLNSPGAGYSRDSSEDRAYFTSWGFVDNPSVSSTGAVLADGDVTAFSTTTSDERLKRDIIPVGNALNKVNELTGYTFTYNHKDRKSAGLIAQDLEKVLPSAVKESAVMSAHGDDTMYKTVEYSQVTALLVEAIKELSYEVEDLKFKLAGKF